MTRVILPPLVVGLLALLITFQLLMPANSQTRCMPREMLVKNLTEKYNESVTVTGTVNDRYIMEMYVAESGTWTMVITLPDGRSCIHASGDDWDMFEAKPAGLPL